MNALQENPDNQYVAQRHFEAARAEVLPRTPPELLALYRKFGGKRDPDRAVVSAAVDVAVDVASLEAAFGPQAIPATFGAPLEHSSLHSPSVAVPPSSEETLMMDGMADLEIIHEEEV